LIGLLQLEIFQKENNRLKNTSLHLFNKPIINHANFSKYVRAQFNQYISVITGKYQLKTLSTSKTA